MSSMNNAIFSVARYGTRLGTRSEGEQARGDLLAMLDTLPAKGCLIISLDGVDVLSGSFADEAVGKALQLLVGRAYGDRTMILRSPTLELTEDLADKLDQRKLAMLCVVGDAWSVIGRVAAPLRETLARVIERETVVVKDLADTLGIPANTCHNRIRRLVELRLIREEATGASAPQTQYRFRAIRCLED